MRATYFGTELYHHGVLGMKWGVRRYQNYDGTRIGTNSDKKTSKPLSYNDASKMVVDSKYWDKHPYEASQVSELGLKALNKIDNDNLDPKDKNMQDWFLYEDQTIGYKELAKMVNDGYTKESINKVMNYTEDNNNWSKINGDSLDFSEKFNNGLWNISVAADGGHMRSRANAFVDACYDIKQSEREAYRTKVKQYIDTKSEEIVNNTPILKDAYEYVNKSYPMSKTQYLSGVGAFMLF